MNFFKLYIGDYQRDTAHLSITEHGAYLLMLQHYYATERPLPTGKALHRMLRAQDKSEREAIDMVAAQFWTVTADGLVNGRADNEITKADAQADTNQRIAREREARRKAAREADEQSTNRATNGQPNQTPDTRHQTENRGGGLVGGEGPPKISDEFRDHCNRARPDLDAALVFALFAEHYPPEKRTLAKWQKWVAGEKAAAVLPTSGASDPDSRASVEALGIARGMGKWDELKERWHTYANRVKGVPA